MIQLIFILLGFTSTSNSLGMLPTIQSPSTVKVFNNSTGIDSGAENGNDTGGNTGQKPPFSQP